MLSIFQFRQFQYNTTVAPVEDKFLNLKNSLNNNQNLLDIEIPVNRQGNLMSAENVLTEHYSRFKPVLEELKYHAEIIDPKNLLLQSEELKQRLNNLSKNYLNNVFSFLIKEHNKNNYFYDDLATYLLNYKKNNIKNYNGIS